MITNNVVIVADDHVDSADMLAVLLRFRAKASVLVAYDGGAAVRMALTERPAAVILDLDMPVLNGVQAAHAIRRAPLHRCPMLIAVSGNVEAMMASSQTPVFDHALTKPVDVQRLTEILATVV